MRRGSLLSLPPSAAQLYQSCNGSQWLALPTPSIPSRYSPQLIAVPPSPSLPVVRYTVVAVNGSFSNRWISSNAPSSSSLLLFGGFSSSFATLSDMWHLPAGSSVWQQPQPSTASTVVASRGDAAVALLTSSSLCLNGVAGACVLLVGGVNVQGTQSTFRNDVWLSADVGATWQQLTSAGAFTPRASASISVDSASQVIAMSGGRTSSSSSVLSGSFSAYVGTSLLQDVVLSYDGGMTWSTPLNVHLPVTGASILFSADGFLHLLGGFTSNGSAPLSAGPYTSTLSILNTAALSTLLYASTPQPSPPMCFPLTGLTCLPQSWTASPLSLNVSGSLLALAMNEVPSSALSASLSNTSDLFLTDLTSLQQPWFVGSAGNASQCPFILNGCSCPPLDDLIKIPSGWAVSKPLMGADGLQRLSIQCQSSPLSGSFFIFDSLTSPLFAPFTLTCGLNGAWEGVLPPLDYCTNEYLTPSPVLCGDKRHHCCAAPSHLQQLHLWLPLQPLSSRVHPSALLHLHLHQHQQQPLLRQFHHQHHLVDRIEPVWCPDE